MVGLRQPMCQPMCSETVGPVTPDKRKTVKSDLIVKGGRFIIINKKLWRSAPAHTIDTEGNLFLGGGDGT